MVDNRIITIIKRLQALQSLQSFYLAGGTSLSIRFGHRESVDIDLFCENIIEMSAFTSDSIFVILNATKWNEESL